MAPHATATANQYDSDVGRPKKRPEEKYETPRRGFRPNPPELWTKALNKAKANGETVTDVLNRALDEYVNGDGGER